MYRRRVPPKMVRLVPSFRLQVASALFILTLYLGLNAARSVGPETSPEPPQINVHPPSMSTPPPGNPPAQLKVPSSSAYVPPNERSVSPPQVRDRSASQPPPSSAPRKSVQFAEKPEVSELAPTESEASEPYHHHRHHRDRTARGYEAGDDTDSTPDDTRRRSQRDRDRGNDRSLDPESPSNGDDGRRRRHHRRRSADPSSRSSTSRGDFGSGSSSRGDPNRAVSPADSDATVELPARFDDKGKKKAESGDDPMADRIDEILQGKGTAGKLFGNFVGGLFGPDGRKKKG